MPKQWTIYKNDVHGSSHKSHLIGCHIQVNNAGTAYQFEAPNGTVAVVTPGNTLPTTPFNFPMFRSALNGDNAHDWYISVKTVTGGNSKNQAEGTWSNSKFPGATDSDSDTWVAQAGSGVGDDEEDTAAASA